MFYCSKAFVLFGKGSMRWDAGCSCSQIHHYLSCVALLEYHYCLNSYIFLLLESLYYPIYYHLYIRDSYIQFGACLYRPNTVRPIEDMILWRHVYLAIHFLDQNLLDFARQEPLNQILLHSINDLSFRNKYQLQYSSAILFGFYHRCFSAIEVLNMIQFNSVQSNFNALQSGSILVKSLNCSCFSFSFIGLLGFDMDSRTNEIPIRIDILYIVL